MYKIVVFTDKSTLTSRTLADDHIDRLVEISPELRDFLVKGDCSMSHLWIIPLLTAIKHTTGVGNDLLINLWCFDLLFICMKNPKAVFVTVYESYNAFEPKPTN